VSFDLALSSDRINGAYPLTIDLQAQDTNGNTIQQTFTSYVTIAVGKDTNASLQRSFGKTQSQQKIIVSGYSENPSPVEAGTDSQLPQRSKTQVLRRTYRT
jgi:phage tail sheath gpL-like